MKKNINIRMLLSMLLLGIELGVFILLSLLLGIDLPEIELFAALYFLMLAFEDHFWFSNLMVWHSMLELLKHHFLYWCICGVLMAYLHEGHLKVMTVLIVSMFIITFLLERVLRKLTRNVAGVQVLVLGAGEEAEKLHILFDRNRFLYINPLAYVSTENITGAKNSVLIEETAKVIQPADIQHFLENHWIDELYIIDDLLTSVQLERITSNLHSRIPVIRHKANTKTVAPGNVKIADYDAEMFTTLSNRRHHYLGRIIRKIADVAAGVVGCLLLLPIAAFVKLGYLKNGDKAPILFQQNRFGKDGKLIKVYKFRTMVPNAEQLLEEMMARDPKIREEYLINKKLDPDPRITPFGNFLRKTSLDELPQMINILKGDMTLIGPRPYLPREKEDMGDSYETIVKFKPGLTGIWQSTGRSNITFAERCKLDEYYYHNWSLWLDLVILTRTVKCVFLKHGAI